MITVVPYADRVVVRLVEPKAHTKAGLEVFEFDKDQTDCRLGEIVALSNGAMNYPDKQSEPISVTADDNLHFRLGDWIIFNRHAYVRFALTDSSGIHREYGVVRFVDIMGVVFRQVVGVVNAKTAST